MALALVPPPPDLEPIPEITNRQYFLDTLALLSNHCDDGNQIDHGLMDVDHESMDPNHLRLPNIQSNELTESKSDALDEDIDINDCLVSKENIYPQTNQNIPHMVALPSSHTVERTPTNRFFKSTKYNAVPNEAAHSTYTANQYNPFSNANEATTINFDEIHTEQIKYQRGQTQRNMMDSNIENMDKTEILKWTKYCVRTGETLKRNVEIRIVKTSTRIHGYRQGDELPLDKIRNITKSWIKDQKTQFIIDILNIFFNIPPNLCGKTREETQSILSRKMAFKQSDSILKDVILRSIKVVAKVLVSPFGVCELLRENMLDNECLCGDGVLYENVFWKIFEKVIKWKIFDELINIIWNYYLRKLSLVKTLKAFDAICQNVLIWYQFQPHLLPNFTKLTQNRMRNIESRFKTNFDGEYNFHTFFIIVLDQVKISIIGQIRIKIIQQMYEQIDCDQSNVTQYQVYSFFGAALNDTFKFYEKYYPDDVGMIKHLLISDHSDIRIPDRLKEENRGNLKIPHPITEQMVSKALYSVKEQVTFRLNTSVGDPMISEVIMNIRNRKDLQGEFDSFFMNAEDVKQKAIETLYEKLMTSLLNKACWSIIRTREYTKSDIALRLKAKIQSCSKGNNTNPYGM
eukprot:118145_1